MSDEIRTVKKKVAISTISQIISQILIAILGVLTLKLITNDLGVKSYGVYATVLAFVSMFALLTDLGVNAINGREIAKHPENAADIIGQNIGLRLSLCVLMVPLIFGLSFLFYPQADDQLRYGILLLTGFLFFDAIRAVLLGYFTAHVRGHITAIINSLQQVMITSLVLAVIIANLGFYGFIFSYIIANTVSMTITFIIVSREIRIRPRIDFSKWRKIILMSLSLGVIQLINMLYFKIDSIMLSVIQGTTAVGIYGIAYSLISAFLMLPSFIMTALIPSMATASKEIVASIVQKAIDYMLIFSCLLAIGAFIVRDEIILVITSPDFMAAATPFAVLAVATAFSYINSVFGFASVSLNKHHKLIYVSVGALVVNIILNLLLIPHYSFNGAACATLVTEILALVGAYYIFRRETGIRPKILIRIVKPFFSALLTLGIINLLHGLITIDNNLIMLILLSAEIFTVYALVLFVLKGIPEEIMAIFARIVKKIQEVRP